MAGSPVLGVLGAVALLGASAPLAAAAPPSNDAATAAATFEPYTAENGTPQEQQAVAELVEATADPGVPRCLGPSSFDRTVWYRVPEAPEPREISVEAAGRTLAAIDLAAFVQPAVAPPPQPPPARRSQAAVSTSEPNACGGVGAGGSDAAEDSTSAVALHVPPNRPVLVQVGRRGARSGPEAEQVVLSLRVEPLLDFGTPAGDRGNLAAPLAPTSRAGFVDLPGATITEEDPAQPPCPSLGTVWRRVVPGRSERRLIRASGRGVETLTVFAGKRPTGDNVLDCVNRAGPGALEMVVPTRRRRTVWIRIGTDAPPDGAEATLRILPGAGQTVVDGGPGGFDPTPGGPAGGFPAACSTADARRAKITGRAPSGRAGAYNRFRRVPLSIFVRGASVCDAELRLIGPRGRVYAKGQAIRLTGRRVVRLPRLRTFRSGAYRLKVTAVSRHGRRIGVRTRLRGRLG